MTNVRCVVFDIDDTLYLERDYVRSGFRAVADYLDSRRLAAGFFDKAWQAFLAGRRGDTFDFVLDALGLAPSLVPELVRVYREHQPKIAMLPDAREFIERLSPTCRVAVVSDGPPVCQENKVKALDLPRWCRPIVLTGYLGDGFGKPHSLAFETVEAATGVSGAQCIYVADNPAKDFIAPARLGWQTVRIQRVGSLHEAVPSGPDVEREVRDMSELGVP